MPIGDDFFNVALSGVTTFNETLRASGTQFVPSGSTTQARLKPRAPEPVAGSFLSRPEQQARLGEAFFTPATMRQKNPMKPDQPLIPEDDAVTPDGTLGGSEIIEIGKTYGKLGEFLSNPAAQKFLASLGMAISPNNTSLGESAIADAEANAQQNFRKQLEEGVSSGDAKTPGLSAEGRKSVLDDFNKEGQAEIKANQFDRQFALAEKIEDRNEREGLLENLRKKEENAIRAAVADAQLASAKGDTPLDRVKVLNTTAVGFTRQIDNYATQLSRLRLSVDNAYFGAPSNVKNKRPGYQDDPYYIENIKPREDAVTRLQERQSFYVKALDVLNQSAIDSLLPETSNVIEVNNAQEANAQPPGTIVKLNGQIYVVE